MRLTTGYRGIVEQSREANGPNGINIQHAMFSIQVTEQPVQGCLATPNVLRGEGTEQIDRGEAGCHNLSCGHWPLCDGRFRIGAISG